MMVKISPITMPAPMPCMPRKRISWPMPSIGMKVSVPAAPHSAEVATNTVAPSMKNGFRPKMSDRLAKIGTEIVDVSRYAVATHGYRSNPESCAMMRGSAVPTIV